MSPASRPRRSDPAASEPVISIARRLLQSPAPGFDSSRSARFLCIQFYNPARTAATSAALGGSALFLAISRSRGQRRPHRGPRLVEGTEERLRWLWRMVSLASDRAAAQWKRSQSTQTITIFALIVGAARAVQGKQISLQVRLVFRFLESWR